MRRVSRYQVTNNERGAALVSTLLIATLLLGAGAALILTTAMTATTTIDSTAEIQAYYGAEAGLNETLNVLRGNVASASTAGMESLDADMRKMRWNFRLAVDPATSNAQGDPLNEVESAGLTGVARLSRWLNYSYPGNGLTDSLGGVTASRVPVSPNYDVVTGVAYSIEITDPDDPTGAKRTDVTYQPSRLLVVSTGYGPRGAIKRLEMMVNRLSFEFTPRSTILLRGADDGSPITNFDSGSSNSKNYTGEDNYPSGQEPLPVFGLTNGTDLNTIDAIIDSNHPATVADPKSTNLNISDLNEWLQTADKARALVTKLRETAQSMERQFSSFPNNNAGTIDEPKFTFVDGDADIGPNFQGAGLLVVTGDMTLHGSTDFYGLILVLGDGSVSQGNGGGNGDILGGIVVARFGSTGDFLAPTFNVNGGGNSNKQYDSDWIRKAMDLAGRPVLGVVER